MGNSLVFSCLYPIFPAYSFCRPYRFIPLSIYYRGLECLVEINNEMRVRSDLTTKTIQQRHFLGLHLQPSQFHNYSNFCNISGVSKLSSGLDPKHSQGDTSKV